MWHEARKQERIIRKVIVDYRKRAERRHDFYQKIKQDPTKFMQVHGRRCSLLIDETGGLNDNINHTVAWQGDKTNMIDRFDVRAHLDYIPPLNKDAAVDKTDKEFRKCNYERYRVLVYNKHRCVKEPEHLHKIFVNENHPSISCHRDAEARKQLLASSRTSIGFDYNTKDGTASTSLTKSNISQNDDSDNDSDEDFLDEIEDIPQLHEFSQEDLHDLERCSMEFGMFSSDFSNFLTADLKAQMKLSEAKAVENEKQKMSGKKSRRERRHARDLRLKNRVIGRLSYMQEVNTHDSTIDSESNSNSSDADDKSPTECSHSEAGEEIEFITSFGENSNDPVKPRDAKHKKRNIDSRLYKDKNKDHTTTSNKKHYQANCSRRSPSPRHRSSERNEKILTKKLRAPTAPAAVKSATPQEKLKIKMQRALKKQLKADRIAIAEKRSQAYNEQVERDEELREIAKKMRRKDDCDSPIQYRRR